MQSTSARSSLLPMRTAHIGLLHLYKPNCTPLGTLDDEGWLSALLEASMLLGVPGDATVTWHAQRTPTTNVLRCPFGAPSYPSAAMLQTHSFRPGQGSSPRRYTPRGTSPSEGQQQQENYARVTDGLRCSHPSKLQRQLKDLETLSTTASNVTAQFGMILRKARSSTQLPSVCKHMAFKQAHGRALGQAGTCPRPRTWVHVTNQLMT